jgi:small subunit ribosomal protein S6
MSYYESVFIARQDISAPQVETLADTFTEIISGGGGNVTKREYWGLRNLAYRIKKNRKGHYMLLNIDAPPAAIQDLERNMRISEDILRYMTIRVDELDDGPSVMARSRGTRDDQRPRRDDHQDRGPRRHERTATDDQPADEAPDQAPASDATAPSDEEKKAEAPAAETGDDKAPAETAPETAKDSGGAETTTEGDKT